MKRLIVFSFLFLSFYFVSCKGKASIGEQNSSDNQNTIEFPEVLPREVNEMATEKMDVSIAGKEAKLVFIDKRIVRVSDDIKTSSIFKKNIRIKNEGDVDLLILNYKVSCNCTTAKLPAVLKPGELGEIVIEIDTTGKLGKNTVTVLFETNTAHKDYVIRIDMNIIH